MRREGIKPIASDANPLRSNSAPEPAPAKPPSIAELIKRARESLGHAGDDNDDADGDQARHGDGGDQARRGNYHTNKSEKHAGKPFTDAHLLAQGYRLARVFTYELPDGTPLFYENRYELRPEIAPTKEQPHKTLRFRHVVNGASLFDTGPRRIIYNWPAIMRAGPGASVFVTEGANKSEPLNAKGLLATAAPYTTNGERNASPRLPAGMSSIWKTTTTPMSAAAAKPRSFPPTPAPSWRRSP